MAQPITFYLLNTDLPLKLTIKTFLHGQNRTSGILDSSLWSLTLYFYHQLWCVWELRHPQVIVSTSRESHWEVTLLGEKIFSEDTVCCESVTFHFVKTLNLAFLIWLCIIHGYTVFLPEDSEGATAHRDHRLCKCVQFHSATTVTERESMTFKSAD